MSRLVSNFSKVETVWRPTANPKASSYTVAPGRIAQLDGRLIGRSNTLLAFVAHDLIV